MGARNVLIEGGSATGKTAVCHELRRRGHHALNGDRDLACCGDPVSGARLIPPDGLGASERAAWVHGHHIWDLNKVMTLVGDRSRPVTYFCGGARNLGPVLHWFDAVFVLTIDGQTLRDRLAARPGDEFGGRKASRDLILALHESGADLPPGAVAIDATASLAAVVDDVLRC